MVIDRREFLRRAAVVLGGGLSASCVSAVLARDPGARLVADAPVLEARERAVLEALTERILPRTATPGALDAGVPDFVEFVLAEGYGAEARQAYRGSLRALDASARSRHQLSFDALAGAEQDAMLNALELHEFAAAGGALALFAGLSDTKPFFAASKELTVVGYYTSEVGIAAERTYSHFPGVFDGAVEWRPGRKPWAGEL